MKSIIIKKNKEPNLLIKIINQFVTWSLLLTAFWINYRFIGSNNFLDLIIFSFSILLFCIYLTYFNKDKTITYELSDENIKEIEIFIEEEIFKESD